jgi:DNA-binding transcriptional LysR family regulator
MDRLEAMSIVVAAVDAGSLSAAGRRLGIPLATVSRKVSELEAHLKTRLFNRSTRKLELTATGQSYVEACRSILEDVGKAERDAAGEYSAPKGELTLTAPIVFGRLHVLPVVLGFLETYPDVDVRLVLVDRWINLLEDHVDLAVRIGELPDSSLVATRIGAIRSRLCASPAYLATRGTPKTLGDLGAHDCITFEGLSSPHTWLFATAKAETSVLVHSRLAVNTAEAAIDAALAGVGITRVLSYQIADAVAAGTLAIVLEKFEPAPSPVNLVYAGQARLPVKLRAFVDFAAPRLKARLPQGAVRGRARAALNPRA